MRAYYRRVNGFGVSKKESHRHIEAENSDGVKQAKKEGTAFGCREEYVPSREEYLKTSVATPGKLRK